MFCVKNLRDQIFSRDILKCLRRTFISDLVQPLVARQQVEFAPVDLVSKPVLNLRISVPNLDELNQNTSLIILMVDRWQSLE